MTFWPALSAKRLSNIKYLTNVWHLEQALVLEMFTGIAGAYKVL